jgi:hypothetical protein
METTHKFHRTVTGVRNNTKVPPYGHWGKNKQSFQMSTANPTTLFIFLNVVYVGANTPMKQYSRLITV